MIANNAVVLDDTDHSFNYLKNYVKNKVDFQFGEAGRKFSVSGESKLFVIVDGLWEIKIGDSKILDFAWEDDLVLVEPLPLEFVGVGVGVVCELSSDSTYYEISLKVLMQDAEAMKCLLEFMSWKACHIYQRWLSLCVNDAYREVKYSIEWLIRLPERVRRRFSLISFITYTTRVSRSHALSILKALKVGGYIEMYDGCVIKILRPLPDRY